MIQEGLVITDEPLEGSSNWVIARRNIGSNTKGIVCCKVVCGIGS